MACGRSKSGSELSDRSASPPPDTRDGWFLLRRAVAIRAEGGPRLHRERSSKVHATRTRWRLPGSVRAAVLAAIAVVAWAIVEIPANAQGVAVKQCGTIIAMSGLSSLDRNLASCPGDGVVITASNVTLDFRGRVAAGTRRLGTAGIRVKGRNVILVNGSVRGFSDGVVVEPGAQVDVQRLNIWSNAETGVSTRAGSNGSTIYLSTFKDNPIGVSLSGSSNLVHHSYFDIIFPSAQGYVGVVVHALHGTAVGNVVSHNDFSNARIGIAVGTPGSDLPLESTTVSRNVVRSGRPGSLGLQAGILIGSAQKTQVSSNGVVQQDVGILVQASELTFETNLTDNSAIQNRGDGIDVRSPIATITRNSALANIGVGIRTVAGVTNGGGNVARGNGTDCIPATIC
jgi:hypothetical protein